MSISYAHEIQRKLIHLSSLWMPLLIATQSRAFSLTFFTLLVLLMLSGEWLRHRVPLCAELYQRYVGKLLRPHENGGTGKSFTGATYVVLAAFLCTLLFPHWVAVTALSIMLVGDACASLVGRRWGRRMLAGKTLEGSLAFAASGLATVAIIGLLADFDNASYIRAGAAVMTALVAELYARHIRLDDNLLVPLVAGFTMMLF
ncbi:MAG: hypothetical protein IT567_04230 [Alphaproteobacteria bacterium]|nr:hypothetical protein [Alphaproteobacteria bacterium]